MMKPNVLYAETVVFPAFVIVGNVVSLDKYNKHGLYCAVLEKDLNLEKFQEIAKKHSARFRQITADENGVIRMNFKVFANGFSILEGNKIVESKDIKQQSVIMQVVFYVTKTALGVFSGFRASAVKIVPDVPVARLASTAQDFSKLINFELDTNKIDGCKEDKAPWDF